MILNDTKGEDQKLFETLVDIYIYTFMSFNVGSASLLVTNQNIQRAARILCVSLSSVRK